jgi:hypothetical protein
MTLAQKKIQIAKSQRKMITTVTSVDGKTLEQVAPGLKNEFENYSEAFKALEKVLKKRPNLVFTKRVHAAAYAVRA